MTDDEKSDQQRTAEYLRQRLPGFKREATQAASQNNGALKVPCALCGKHYGAVLQTNVKPHCPSCRKMLADGYCALVPHGTIGQAFMFKADGMPADWAGQVVTLPAPALNELKMRYQAQEGKKNGESNL